MTSVHRVEWVNLQITPKEFSLLIDALQCGANWIDHCENQDGPIRVKTARAEAMRELRETIVAADNCDREYH